MLNNFGGNLIEVLRCCNNYKCHSIVRVQKTILFYFLLMLTSFLINILQNTDEVVSIIIIFIINIVLVGVYILNSKTTLKLY